MIISICVIAALVVAIFIFTNQPQFGKLPTGERLERIKKSPNYRNGEFQNLNPTPVMAENINYFKAIKAFMFKRSKRSEPDSVLPSKKIDLKSLNPDSNVVVWFGHSSYFMQLDGKNFLVDPVLSGSISPFRITNKSFKGSDIYSVDDLPDIDYLIITHDHWDHLDYETVTKLKPRIHKIIAALGIGSHLEYWGFDKTKIIELDWYDESKLDSGFVITATPARHFSGRLFKRNQTLWSSFVLKTPTKNIFISGDGGYDTHFKTIGDKFGPFDLAFLECGQYNEYWKYIHCMPEKTVQAAIDLQTKIFIPIHWSKFVLALHDWDEPIIRVTKAAKEKNVKMISPVIGESVNVN